MDGGVGGVVKIFDTTLRDGEQSPGVSLTAEEKLEIARQLANLRVDVIEAGFPFTSEGDFEAVRNIAREVQGPVIAGLARTSRKDIERAAEALKPAARSRIHVFTSGSDVHLKHMLRKTPDEVLAVSVEMVKYARNFTDDVEFSAQDTARSNREFLYRLYEAAIKAGATTINVPDTVGYAIPEEFADLIRSLRENVANIDKAIISVHCHNDLGLAAANSLAAIRAGARQVEVTINGIGERAGNTSLEEVVMAIKTRKDLFGLTTNVDTRQIYRASRMVASLTGMPVQPNKAVVGDNAFAHESGIHQDGVLKEAATYEIMRPEDIGLGSNRLVMGKHSGRHAFRERLVEMGYDLSDEDVTKIFKRFKDLADKKKGITDRDLEAIVQDELYTVSDLYQLEYFHVSSGNRDLPTATIEIKGPEGVVREAACGEGPVDALCKAVDRAVGRQCQLTDYSLKAVTAGKDALGEVTLRLEEGHLTATGRGVSTDVLEASARAYVNAINKLAAYSGVRDEADEADEARRAI